MNSVPATIFCSLLIPFRIGQKLSERMESFSFTHLVNNLRREIHIELGNPTVKPLLRPNHGGIMALPVSGLQNMIAVY